MDQGSKQRPSPRSLSQAFMQVWSGRQRISIFGGMIFLLHTFLWQGTDGKASVRNRTALLAFFGQVGKYFGIWTHHGHHSNF